MSSCEAVGDRCASAQARLEGLGRDAVDGEVSPALTAELTDVNIARATTCDVGRMETEKRRKERRNERTSGHAGERNVGVMVVLGQARTLQSTVARVIAVASDPVRDCPIPSPTRQRGHSLQLMWWT
jgi:creatinine amidohydrolase/Fe(II)-dependent formamide hydrolase-like protein